MIMSATLLAKNMIPLIFLIFQDSSLSEGRKFILWILTVAMYYCHEGSPSLTLTTNPFSKGSFCPRPVNITCTGSEVSFTLVWKNGSDDIMYYIYRSSDDFPYHLSLLVPLQGVTSEVTTATLSIRSHSIDIVSTLFVANVSVLNGYSISCEDGLGVRSGELNISAKPQG